MVEDGIFFTLLYSLLVFGFVKSIKSETFGRIPMMSFGLPKIFRFQLFEIQQ